MTPASLWSSYTLSYISKATTNRWGGGVLDSAFATSADDALLAKLSISCFQNPNFNVFQLVKLHIHLTIQCLFYLFLLVLRLLAGQVPSCFSLQETIAKPSPHVRTKIGLMRCHLLCVLLCLTMDRIKRIWLHTQ
jgi:hypothetical protein